MCDCRIQVKNKSEISAGVNFMLVRTKTHVGSLPSFLLGQAPVQPLPSPTISPCRCCCCARTFVTKRHRGSPVLVSLALDLLLASEDVAFITRHPHAGPDAVVVFALINLSPMVGNGLWAMRF